MPSEIHIEPETGIAVVTCSGVLRLDEAREAAAAVWKAPGWAGRASVWDFRMSEFDLSTSDARDAARFILQHQPTPPPEKVAFVANSDVDFGMARMYGAFRDESSTAFRVFRDFDVALQWVAPESGAS